MKQICQRELYIIILVQKKKSWQAVFQRIGSENTAIFAQIRDNKNLNGIEKLRVIFKTAVLYSKNESILLTVSPSLLNNSQFLAMQIEQIYRYCCSTIHRTCVRAGNKG